MNETKIAIANTGYDSYAIAIITDPNKSRNLETLLKRAEKIGSVDDIQDKNQNNRYVLTFLIKPIISERHLFGEVIKTAKALHSAGIRGDKYETRKIDEEKHRVTFTIDPPRRLTDLTVLLWEGREILESANTYVPKPPGPLGDWDPGNHPLRDQISLDLEQIYSLLNTKLNITPEIVQSSSGANNSRASRAVISTLLMKKYNLSVGTIAKILDKSKPTIRTLSQRFTNLPTDLDNLEVYVNQALAAYNGEISLNP